MWLKNRAILSKRHQEEVIKAWEAKGKPHIILVPGKDEWMGPAVVVTEMATFLSKPQFKENLKIVFDCIKLDTKNWLELAEVKMAEHLFIPVRDVPGWEKMTKEEKVATLKERIKLGDKKLNDGWEYIHDNFVEPQLTLELRRWTEAAHKLLEMRDQIRLWGFNGCLYAGPDGKPSISCLDGVGPQGCMACPSDEPYWHKYWEAFGRKEPTPVITKEVVEADSAMMRLPVYDPKQQYFKGAKLRDWVDGKWKVKEIG